MDKTRKGPSKEDRVVELDKQLRQQITDYYMAVKGLNNREKAVSLLADHVAILVEMINDIKSG